MDIGRGIGEAIGCVIVLAVVVTALVMGVIWYSTIDNTITSDKIIVPEIRLVTDGKKIDTVFVYGVETD